MMSNRMTDLLEKIERRLALAPLNLPDFLDKNQQAKVISKDSITTFSRFFPHMITIYLTPDVKNSDGYYLIDEVVPDHVEILGVKDINWDLFAQDSIRWQQSQGYGVWDFLNTGYGMADIALAQTRADNNSMFNTGLYIDFKEPNRLRIISVTGAEVLRNINTIPVDIHIKHHDNLMTISPTMMETFERLAIADVARFLFSNLKYYDGINTAYASIDMRLADLEQEANKREDVVAYMNETYVSVANKYQPAMIVV